MDGQAGQAEPSGVRSEQSLGRQRAGAVLMQGRNQLAHIFFFISATVTCPLPSLS